MDLKTYKAAVALGETEFVTIFKNASGEELYKITYNPGVNDSILFHAKAFATVEGAYWVGGKGLQNEPVEVIRWFANAKKHFEKWQAGELATPLPVDNNYMGI